MPDRRCYWQHEPTERTISGLIGGEGTGGWFVPAPARTVSLVCTRYRCPPQLTPDARQTSATIRKLLVDGPSSPQDRSGMRRDRYDVRAHVEVKRGKDGGSRLQAAHAVCLGRYGAKSWSHLLFPWTDRGAHAWWLGEQVITLNELMKSR